MINLNLTYDYKDNKDAIHGSIYFYNSPYMNILKSKKLLQERFEVDECLLTIRLDISHRITDPIDFAYEQMIVLAFCNIKITMLTWDSSPRVSYTAKIIENRISNLRDFLSCDLKYGLTTTYGYLANQTPAQVFLRSLT
jgi:hypothetical protein